MYIIPETTCTCTCFFMMYEFITYQDVIQCERPQLRLFLNRHNFSDCHSFTAILCCVFVFTVSCSIIYEAVQHSSQNKHK